MCFPLSAPPAEPREPCTPLLPWLTDGNGRRWEMDTKASTPHVRSTNSQQCFEVQSGPARFQFPVSTFPASTADLHLPRQLPLSVAPAGLQAWSMTLQGPALSPPPSPPLSVPCPHLIAPLILAPLRNRLDDVPFRLNFFLGVRAVRCAAVSQSRASQASA